jgi:hypothetical protein
MSDEQKIQMMADALCAKHKAARVVISLEYPNGSSINFESKGPANDR